MGEFALGALTAVDRAHQRSTLDALDLAARRLDLVDLLSRDVPLFDQLGESPLIFDRQEIDFADLAEVHPHGIGRAALALRRRLLRASLAPAAQQALVGILGGRRLDQAGVTPQFSRRVVAEHLDGLVDHDALCRHRGLDLGEHITGEFDVPENVRHLFGVQRTGFAAARDQAVPLPGLDPAEWSVRNRGTFDRVVSRHHRCGPLSVD